MDFQMKGKAGPDLIQTICFDLPISPVISSSGKASFTPCSPKAEEAQGLHHPPPPLLTAHLSPLLYTHTHTHIHHPHPHWTLFWKSRTWFKIPLQSMSCILYAWRVGKREEGLWGFVRRGVRGMMGRVGASNPNELPSAVAFLRDISVHTTITALFCSSPLIFSRPLNSFNISFTA